MRALTATMKVGTPGPEGSIAKLQWSSTNQALTELAVEVGGIEALSRDSLWAYRFLRSRANSIEGGTSDVLRNIIAERVLGLPKLR
jgi:alkylation response protein AidB-like acyl-CoA dehydrogenase